MYTIYLILTILRVVLLIVGVAYILWLVFGEQMKQYLLLPTYKKLEKKYNAKYPTIMNEIYSPFDELSVFDDSKAFFLVSDNCFRIVSLKRPDLNIEIPFYNILCHRNYILDEKTDTHYKTLFQLCILINGVPKWLGFKNLPYNHKIDKKYGNRLNGKDLYNFICEKFMHKDEYKAQNPNVEL